MERLLTHFFERGLFCWHLKPQRIMHLRHLYVSVFMAVDVKQLKFLFSCYASEISTKSVGFLKY